MIEIKYDNQASTIQAIGGWMITRSGVQEQQRHRFGETKEASYVRYQIAIRAVTVRSRRREGEKTPIVSFLIQPHTPNLTVMKRRWISGDLLSNANGGRKEAVAEETECGMRGEECSTEVGLTVIIE